MEDFDPTEPNVIKLFSYIIYEFFNELVFDRLGLKSLPRTNTLAWRKIVYYRRKMFFGHLVVTLKCRQGILNCPIDLLFD